MTRLPFSVHGLAALVGLVMISAACEGNPVGRTCFISSDAGAAGVTVISSPALECQSRTCLHFQGHTPDMCTGECSSDDDCDKDESSECAGKFICAIPVVVGPFCCKRMCICGDYFGSLDGGPPTPAACASENPDNECCNLDGRRNNAAMYPQCQ